MQEVVVEILDLFLLWLGKKEHIYQIRLSRSSTVSHAKKR